MNKKLNKSHLLVCVNLCLRPILFLKKLISLELRNAVAHEGIKEEIKSNTIDWGKNKEFLV